MSKIKEIEALKAERDALRAHVASLQYYIRKYQELGADFILSEALTKTPQQCLRDIQAEAGRVGYFEAAMNYDPDYDPWWSADQYAESVRKGTK